MADFIVRVQGGVSWQTWDDGERAPGTDGANDKGAPSRVANDDDHPQPYMTVVLGATVVMEMSVDDGATWVPLDADLGGRLFYGSVVERPVAAPPHAVIATPLQSSEQSFTPNTAGHYAVMIRRPQGGAVLLHFDVA